MNNLLPGLRKFSEKVFPAQQPLFEKLSTGQQPHTLMITCSDSRIDPNLVTQTKPGELFVVRNAGNIVPPFGSSRGGEEAAIEFAIDGLKVSNIVICGHSQCGAMKALMNPETLTKLPSVLAWLNHAQATKRIFDSNKSAPKLNEVIEENVLVQINNLKTHPAVSAAIARGQVQVFAWVYEFETGAVTLYDPIEKKYVSSSRAAEHEADSQRFSL